MNRFFLKSLNSNFFFLSKFYSFCSVSFYRTINLESSRAQICCKVNSINVISFNYWHRQSLVNVIQHFFLMFYLTLYCLLSSSK